MTLVSSVQSYAIPEGKSGPQTVENLQKRIESLGGTKASNFCIDCETYYSVPNINPQRAVNILHNSENPATTYAILDTGTCLVVDNLFDHLMGKLSTIYTPKKATRIESKGQSYELKDFLVKIGSVSMGSSFKGILIEVIEYQPCVIPAICFDLMKEFIQGFIGVFGPNPPPCLQNKMNDIHTPIDIMFQYMEHFNNLRKIKHCAYKLKKVRIVPLVIRKNPETSIPIDDAKDTSMKNNLYNITYKHVALDITDDGNTMFYVCLGMRMN
uniref:Mediator of RNA polymerase II transcription subunit 20 n=1 Tax=Strigamia maritima TaxID=126957 RepID=T1IQF9_STRMM